MEPTPSKVRNHYSQKNQEAHIERALAFKKAANLHCPSNVCIPIIFLRASHCGWLIRPSSFINQDDETVQEIGDDNSEDTGELTTSSEIEEDNLDHQQEVLHLGQSRRDKSVCTTCLPLPKKRSHADAVIVRPPLANSRNQLAAMAPPVLKRQKSSLLNKLSESDHAPSARALVLPNKSSGDQNIAPPKASSGQNVLQHQKATFEVAKRFMEAILFTKTIWRILSDDKYWMVGEAWNLAIEA